jgi:FMN phosphatase YigB (HAD superfamily)
MKKKVTKKRGGDPTWSKDEHRIVLFDLDSTLMDSDRAREEGWNRALAKLEPVLKRRPEHTLLAYKAIYSCHPLITNKVGPRGHRFEDMRQEWNTRTSYALLIAWSLRRDFPDGASDVSFYEASLQTLLRTEETMRDLLRTAEEIRDPWTVEFAHFIDQAIDAFWVHDWKKYLYPGVKELLRACQERGLRYYIATEGHLPTQWRKIMALGLASTRPEGEPLVRAGQVLATSQAARPSRELYSLKRLADWYRGQATAGKEALEALGTGIALPNSDAYKRLQQSSKVAEKTADGLDRIGDIFQHLATKYNTSAAVDGKDDGAEKVQVRPDFYLRVLYAINQSIGNPAKSLAQFTGINWTSDKRKMRLAMVGDRFSSDVRPILELGYRYVNASVMSIWVRGQGRHGSADPDKNIPPGSKYVECQTIKEAGDMYLLRAEEWLRSTTPIEKPEVVFLGTIDPKDGESLAGNLEELVIAFGALNSPTDLLQRVPDRETVERARSFVSEVRHMVVEDIRRGSHRDQVTEILSVLCKGKFAFFHSCPGFIPTVLQLLLEIAKEDSTELSRNERYHNCLKVLSSLLDSDNVELAAATLRVLFSDHEARGAISNSEELAAIFDAKLRGLAERNTGFADVPIEQLDIWRSEIQASRKEAPGLKDAEGSAELTVKKPQIEFVQLGRRVGKDGEGRIQQNILVGHSPTDQPVRCFLCGEARNVISICGGTGSGKSSTINALVRGALEGDTIVPDKRCPASVIVFHREPPGACEIVKVASGSGHSTDVFTFKDDLASITPHYKEYTDTKVFPLRFKLGQLPNDTIGDFLGLSAQHREVLDQLLKREKDKSRPTVGSLIDAVSSEQQLRRSLQKIRNGLKELDQLIASSQEEAFEDRLKPGKLTIIHCLGQGASRANRLRAWNMVLSILGNDERKRKEDEYYLLVLDELHHGFPKRSEQWTDQLSRKLVHLMRMGRHVHASLVAASQDPADFQKQQFAPESTVVFFHSMEATPRKMPSGSAWDLAKKRDPEVYRTLAAGEAFHFSMVDGHERTGRVRVKR